MIESDSGDRPRRLRIYKYLLLSAMIWLTFRVLIVSGVDQRTPFLSANDRSRWCTVRSLVEEGTYRIDNVISNRGWDSIDKVSHLGTDGEQHYYSSKPPLLATMISSLYWLLYQTTGLSFGEHPFQVGRLLIFAVNGPLLAALLFFSISIIEKWGRSDWGRIFSATVIAWGTFLTTFAVTLNNHLPATLGVVAATMGLLNVWYDNRRSISLFALIGFAAAMAAANELPCLSFLALAGLACVIKSPKLTMLGFVPAMLLVVAGFFGTNKLAHDSWRPPYMHRATGEDWSGDHWYNYEKSYWLAENRRGVDRGEPSKAKYALHTTIGHHGVLSLSPIWLLSIAGTLWLWQRERRFAAVLTILSLTMVCWTFYVFLRPVGDRNYAGLCCGFRWMFWLIPLWLVALLPAADWLAENKKWHRAAWILFGVSAFSALYGSIHPWVHPWPYALLQLISR